MKRMILASLWFSTIIFFRCGPGNNKPQNDNSVTVGYFGDESIFFQDNMGMEATYLIFLPLVARDGDEYDEVQPVLAERWEHSRDYRKWTYYLRKNIKWHDGMPVTAHDIKFTIDLRSKINSLPDSLGIKVEIIDDYTVTVTNKRPTDGLDTYNVYYPKHLLENLDPKNFWTWKFWTEPVGNGPYRYVRHIPKTMVEVEANPEYFRGKPKIEKVILKFIQSSSFVELSSGNIDAMSYVKRNMLRKLSNGDRFRFYHWWGGYFEAIYWNHHNPLFSSPAVRKALTMAINRKELGEFLNYPEGVPIMDAITTHRQFHEKLYAAPYPYDPIKARNILSEAGWCDIDGDGILERNGKEFRFLAIQGPPEKAIAIYVQDQFSIS